jgi:hypothetical protein
MKEGQANYEKRNWRGYGEELNRFEKALDEVVYIPFRSAFDLPEIDTRKIYPKEPNIRRVSFSLPSQYHLMTMEDILTPCGLPELPTLPRLPVLRNAEDLKSGNENDAFSVLFKKFSDALWQNDKLWLEKARFVLNDEDFENKRISHDQCEYIDQLLLQDRFLILQVKKDEKEASFLALERETLQVFSALKRVLKESPSGPSICEFIKLSHQRHPLPIFLRRSFEVTIDPSSRTVVIEFEFPDYTNVQISYDYKGRFKDNLKLLSPPQKKKTITVCLYSLIIRAGLLAANCNVNRAFDSIAINVKQSWFDPATGAPCSGIIASVLANADCFQKLDISKLDPEACFRSLKGLRTPNLENSSTIRPVFALTKDDDRFVAGRDVEAALEPETNLASMEWEDFEHLVAQLFEWEFMSKGMEIKVTRTSRDRGVDAVLFDPDPFRGGKYVLQAKRYTRTVDVSSVRDLYGTVVNEGANRGILITTASFGPDSYDFAKDKPISLIDGPNLLLMLKRHGRLFRIDLDEARRLNLGQI